jgi:hypothetical protein
MSAAKTAGMLVVRSSAEAVKADRTVKGFILCLVYVTVISKSESRGVKRLMRFGE